MAKLTLKLHVTERAALFKLAESERRDPRALAALIIRGELERRGLLPVNADAMSQRDAAQQEGARYATS